MNEGQAVDEEAPCHDECACDRCWKGWTSLTKKMRLINRLQHLAFHDVQVEHIPPSLHQTKVMMAIEWFMSDDDIKRAEPPSARSG